jgi:hypothetical protein
MDTGRKGLGIQGKWRTRDRGRYAENGGQVERKGDRKRGHGIDEGIQKEGDKD